jgi:hypothetical protein
VQELKTVLTGWKAYFGIAVGMSPLRGIDQWVRRRFHDDQANIAIGKPALELRACQALGFDHAPGRIGHGQLEDGLCQINGNGCSIHVGLLSFEDLIPTPMKTRAPMWRQKRGESIPSIDTDAQVRPAASRPPVMRAGHFQHSTARGPLPAIRL